MPSPLELAPETIVIHGVLVVAVQLHNGPEAVTLTVRVTSVPGFVGKLTTKRLSVKTQLVACCTENVCLAIVSDPLLTLKGLNSTENATEPLPLPLAPDAIEIQESLLDAVHAHPFSAETVTLGPAPPPALAA